MPWFHFHTDELKDVIGIELESVAAAKCEAIKLAGRIICDEVDSFWDNAEWTLTVTDDQDLVLFRLSVVGTESPVLRMQASRSARA